MGIYEVNCVGCEKSFPWFSGSNKQFCEECKKGAIMSGENKEIEYLNKIIKLQQEMIDMLKVEIDRLKITNVQLPSPQPIVSPVIGPGIYPSNPGPWVPGYPGDILNPFVVTCGDPTSPGAGNSYSNSGLSTESLEKINGLIKALELSNYTGKP